MKIFQLVIFVFLLLRPRPALSLMYNHTIYINPSGQDSQDCLTANKPSSPCANLTWVFQQRRQDSTNYVLSQGTHELTGDTPQFKDLKHLAFTGNNSSVTCIHTGLVFVKVEGIVFQGITFSGCAASLQHYSSTGRNYAGSKISVFMAGLHFYLCENISMLGVSVSGSRDAAGVFLYNTNGNNTFSHSNFTNNRVVEMGTKYAGGGGLVVEFAQCAPGVQSCDKSTSERNLGATYIFASCHFDNNHANSSETLLSPGKSSVGSGGGLAYIARGNASNNTLRVENCSFSNNSAISGGGLLIQLQDKAHSNFIIIKNTYFLNNQNPLVLSSGTAGAGIRLVHYVYDLDGIQSSLSVTRNEIVIDNCSFTSNTAIYGGGVSLSWAPQKSSIDLVAQVHLIHCNFIRNVAKLGAAIHIDRFWRILQGYKTAVWIDSCCFRENEVFNQLDETAPFELGIGIVYVSSSDVSFNNTALFTSNDGSALAVNAGTAAFIQTSANFSSNRANKGAAMALMSQGRVVLGEGTEMLFSDNHASVKGGAIYVGQMSRQNLASDDNCFFQYSDMDTHPDSWNVTMTFVGNKVHVYENYNAIFASSILPCVNPTLNGLLEDKERVFCWKGWSYYNSLEEGSVNCSSQISSIVGSISYDGKDKEGRNYIDAFPGWSFEIPVVVYDDLGHNISSSSVFNRYIGNQSSVVYGEETSVKGPAGLNKMVLETTSERVWYAFVEVNLLDCPPGFTERNGSCVCASTYAYGGRVICNSKAHDALLKKGYWMGHKSENDTAYYVSLCAFCKKQKGLDRFLDLPNSSQALEDLICAKNHIGRMCGRCKDGFGPAVNTYDHQCVNCTNINLAKNIAKYVAAVYIPQIVLFTALILFDIRLTSGPANAFILFCQMALFSFRLDGGGAIPIDRLVNHPDLLLQSYTLPYGIFNLEFLEKVISPICFSPSFHTLKALVLLYFVAIFPGITIMAVVQLVKLKDYCASKLFRKESLPSKLFKSKEGGIGEAILPAFASFLLLSYAKFASVSMFLLFTIPLIDENGVAHSSKKYVYLAGQFSSTDREYFPFFVIAIFVLCTFVAIPQLVLLDYPLRGLEWLISKSRRLRRIYPMTKIHIFLDTFQGCYKDNMRFFAGLYFLFRLVLIFAQLFCYQLHGRLVVQQIACSVMILLLALCQPYKKTYINYIDVLVFTDLAVLNSLSLFLLGESNSSEREKKPYLVFAVQVILMFLPMLVVIAFLVWKFTNKCLCQAKALSGSRLRILDSLNSKAHDTNSHYNSQAPADPNDPTEALLSRAENINTYRSRLKYLNVTVSEVSMMSSKGSDDEGN